MRGMLGLLLRIILLPVTLLAGLFFTLCVLGTLISFALFFFMPFELAFSYWIKCLLGVVICYVIVNSKERLARWVEGF